VGLAGLVRRAAGGETVVTCGTQAGAGGRICPAALGRCGFQ
jgi:hypothetical protein